MINKASAAKDKSTTMVDSTAKRASWYRPLAIMVEASREEFPALVRKIRGRVSRDIIGNHVVGLRQAKSGGLLIEVRGDTDQIETVRAEVSRSTCTEVHVRTIQQRAMLEIRDIDEWTSKEKVVDAVATSSGTGRDAVKVLNLRRQVGGT